MTKAELIEALSNKLPLNKADAESAINIVLDDIIAALRQGERVNISGFGTFSVSERQARTGRNPKTGESIRDFGEPVGEVQTGQAAKGLAQRRRQRRAGVAAAGGFVTGSRGLDQISSSGRPVSRRRTQAPSFASSSAAGG